jgi:hypothetical protein
VSMRMPFLLLAIALAASGCGKWSSEERRQVDAFTTSIVKADEASTLSPLEVEKVTATLKEALDASSIVTDPVLAKIHPELPEQYRSRFVTALRMRHDALRDLPPGEPLTAKQLEWQIPMAEWGDWYSANVAALRQNIE